MEIYKNKYSENRGYIPRLSVKKAYAKQQSVMQLVIVTTHLIGKIVLQQQN